MLGLGAAAAAAPEAKTTETEIKEGLALLRARLKEKRKLEDDCFKAHEKKAKAELALRLANSRFDSVQALLQPVRNEDFAMDNLLALGRAVLRGGDEDEAMEPEVLPIPGLNPVPPVPPAPAPPAPPVAAPAGPPAPAPAPAPPAPPAPAPPAAAPAAPPADNNDFTITAQDVGAFPTVDVDDSAYDATLHMRCAAVFAHDLPVECNICRGDFKAGDHFVGCANNLCAGRFHINCAARWLDQSVGHYRVVDDAELHGVACCACPVCGLRPFAPDWSDPPDRDRDD